MTALPLQPPDLAGPARAPAATATTILVVDDSPVDRHLAEVLVAKSGCRAVSASNGVEALALMDRERPQAVLTDMLMPEMDGLELTQTIRSRYPLVPVILMTAFGSEDVAIQALQSGAASYVPKKTLARDLPETLEQVLAAVRANRGHQRLLECLTGVDTEFILDNDRTLIPPLIAHLQEDLSRLYICDQTARIRVGIALEEAMLNGMFHGNLEVSSELRRESDAEYYRLAEERRPQEPYRNRRLYVRARVTAGEARYTIRDEGPGYNPASLPDPTDPSNLGQISGRGLLLIRTFMDDVSHNATGNEITMVKRRDPITLAPRPTPG